MILHMLQIILFALFLTLLPAALGYLIVPGGEEETGAYALPAMWCAGFAILMALMHWPAVLAILLGRSLTELTALWVVLVMLLFVLSVIKMLRRRECPYMLIGRYLKGITFPEIAASAAVFAHAAVTAVFMHIDDDDYAFVANATTAVDTNRLLAVIGGTGKALTTYADEGIDRIVSSPQFAFYAAVSKLFGTRPAALCHTYLPPVLTCLFFASFFILGYVLFKKDRAKTGLFAAFTFLAAMSSYYAPYTAGTFLMVRSWQGKAQVVGMILPLLIALYLSVVQKGEMRGRDVLICVVLLEASCLLTSMGAMLAAAEALLLSLVAAYMNKSVRTVLYTLPALLLPLATAVLYLKVGG